MEWMISDSTGIPPAYATPAGFVQDTYGIFKGPAPFGAADRRHGKELAALFLRNPQKKLPFKYGYPDNAHHGHMVITHKPGH
jgi:hypothetical protein